MLTNRGVAADAWAQFAEFAHSEAVARSSSVRAFVRWLVLLFVLFKPSQDGVKEVLRGAKIGQAGAKVSLDGAKMSPELIKMVQRSAKIAPRWV